MMDKWITLPEARKQCLSAGKPITKEGLLWAALKGEAAKKDAKEPYVHHWLIDGVWLQEWLTKSLIPVKTGYLKVADAASTHSITINTLYGWIRSGLVQTERFGTGQGVIHVREKDIQRNIEHRKNGESPTAE